MLNKAQKFLLDKIEQDLGIKFPIFTRQIKWNEFGVYFENRNVMGIGFFSQNISKIPEEIWDIKTLEVINMVNTGIKILDSKIGELSKLKELYIGGNELKEIPQSIKNLIQLEILYILEENLTELPIDIGKLGELKELSITSKYIMDLPKEILLLKKGKCRLFLNNLEI